MSFLVTDLDIGKGLQVINTAGAAGAKVEADLGFGLAFNGNVIDAYAPMANGFIDVVKVGLTGTATANTNLESLSTIATYAWSGTGVTFASPNAASSAYTVIAAGAYDITLVVTTSEGVVATFTRTVKHDYVIEVMGHDSEMAYFSKLSDAWDWISTNDAANGGKYLVQVLGVTADSGTITRPPFNCTVAFNELGLINANINAGGSGSGSLTINGASKTTTCVVGTITTTGASIAVGNAQIGANSYAGVVIDATNASVTLRDATVRASGEIVSIIGSGQNVGLTNAFFYGAHALFNGITFLDTSIGIFFQQSSATSTLGLEIDNCSGTIERLSYRTGGVGFSSTITHTCMKVNLVSTKTLFFQDIDIRSSRAPSAGNVLTGLEVSGTTGTLLIYDASIRFTNVGAGNIYAFVRSGTPTASERYDNFSTYAKTAAFIYLVAGVATAWNNAPIYDSTFMVSNVNALITPIAGVAVGSNNYFA